MAVHAGRKPAEAILGEGKHRLRRFKALAGRERPVKIRRADALHHARQALLAAPRSGKMAAGVDEIDAVDTAARLVRARRRKQKAAVGAVGGIAAGAAADHPCTAHRRDLPVRFGDPAAVKGVHFKFARQIEAKAHQLVDDHRRLAAVFQHGAAGKGGFKHAVEQPQAQRVQPVEKAQLQRLPAARLRQAAGHKRVRLVAREALVMK